MDLHHNADQPDCLLWHSSKYSIYYKKPCYFRQKIRRDFKQVIYDRYIEAMFSNNGSFEGFQDFYLEHARKYGGEGVVDIGCGTIKYKKSVESRWNSHTKYL